MTQGHKIIKGLAIALAVFIIVSILSGIVCGIVGLISIFTDEENLDTFATSHMDRKRERNIRRLERGLNEQLDNFNNYSIGAKQSIHNISKIVIEKLKM